MAELADALRSGRSELTLMRVQVPPSALQDPHLRVFFDGESQASAGDEAKRHPNVKSSAKNGQGWYNYTIKMLFLHLMRHEV